MKCGKGRDARLIPSVYQQCVTECSPPDLIVLRWNLSLVEANTLPADFLKQWVGLEGEKSCEKVFHTVEIIQVALTDMATRLRRH